MNKIRIVDLFCGIGSFHQAAKQLPNTEVVFACDIDKNVRNVYSENYNLEPAGDISEIDTCEVPDHDIICFGSPCQPFSNIGKRAGISEDDTRSTLIFYVINILRDKRPSILIMENVKGLLTSNYGFDFVQVVSAFQKLDYTVEARVLNCWEHGIPQNRQRLFVVGVHKSIDRKFEFPIPDKDKTPSLTNYMKLLREDFPELVKERGYTVRCGGRMSGINNRHNWDSYYTKSGDVYSFTREDCQHLQGFPKDFKWGRTSNTSALKMLGNTIPTCLTKIIMESAVKTLSR